MAKWIEFTDETPSPSGKTKGWRVRSLSDRGHLGYVFWHSPWRKYVFSPTNALGVQTIYEQDCLRDIADFIETKTREHREARKVKRG